MEEQLRQSFDILCPSSGAQQAAAADALQRPLRSRFQARLRPGVRRRRDFGTCKVTRSVSPCSVFSDVP